MEQSIVDATGAPSDRPRESIDVRSCGPPGPLGRTLERIADLPDETVLVRRNDRVPKLDGRGYAYETIERDDVVTVVWRE